MAYSFRNISGKQIIKRLPGYVPEWPANEVRSVPEALFDFCIKRPDVFLLVNGGSSTPSGPSLVVPSYLGQVATGTFIADAIHATNTYGYGRNPHIAQDNITSLQLVFANWYMVSGTETNASNTQAWTASIEYPAGTYTQILFSGTAQGTATGGANLVSDTLAVIIPKGAKFWSRVWTFSTLGKLKYFQYYAGDGTAQNAGGTTSTAIPDVTMGGGFGTTVNKQGNYIGPVAIIANTTRPGVAVVGDSRAVGRGDAGYDGALQGSHMRAFGQFNAVMSIGQSGNTLLAFMSSHTKQVALAQYSSHVHLEFGINDVTNGSSAATIQTNTNTVLGYFASQQKVSICTLSPVTTTTNGWGDVANQTVAANESVRVAVNAQRLTTMPAGIIVYDVDAAVNSSPASGKWAVLPGCLTDDGTHLSRIGAEIQSAAINPSTLLS